VTPAFLASEFIWTEEMPRILKHRESGMLVFPLIVKACAWQLESALERIQARPKGVRPLALASEAEVDRDLAEFIRELAAAVSSVTERTETLPQVTGATELKDQAGQRVKGIWQGTYDSTNRKLRLVVDEESGSTFSGRMEYVNENVCTRVSGKIRSDTPPAGRSTRDWTITFRESVDAAHGVVETRGEYRASLSGQRMKGEWISDRGKRSLGRFEFWRIDDEDLA